MRMIVCVKQIEHIYARTGMDLEQYYLAPEDRVLRVNPYDERAMEIASTMKSVLGAGEIVVVTLGPVFAESELMRCLALGADRFVRVDESDSVDSFQKSSYLAQAIRPLEPDLVLCGKESLDTQKGQLGAFLAQRLGLPFVSAITELSIENRKAQVQRSAGRGRREVIECRLPALFSVDLGAREPHLPTYRDKQAAHTLPVEVLTMEQGAASPMVRSEGMMPPRPRPKWVRPINSGLEAHDRIQQLLTGSRVEKKGLILKGNSESQVEGILSFLKEIGVLKLEETPDGE